MLKKAGLIFLVIIALGAASAFGIYKIFYPGDRALPDKEPEKEEKFTAVGRTNIAVLGVDQRSEDDGRADTIFVVMYDPKAENIAMLSVPRDTRVRIKGDGWDKINHSFNYGGAKATVSTLENFLGIHIDYYVLVDFKAFENMVDAIGGVELDVEKRMYYEDPWDGENGFIIDLQAGKQLLDGKKSIQYVRYRDEEGDLGRVNRQQHFIDAAYQKMLSPELFKALPELAEITYKSVETNMSVVDMLAVARTLHKNARNGVHRFSVPGTPVFIDEINYWVPDVMSVRGEVAQILGLDKNDKFMDASRRTAATYEASLPAFDENLEYSSAKEKEKQLAKEKAEKEEKDKDKKDDADKKDDKTAPKSDTKKDDDKKPDDSKKSDAVNKDDKKPSGKDDKKEPTTNKPAESVARQIRATIVNCSGNPASADKMANLLRNNGIAVGGVSNGSEQGSSVIVSHTQNSWVVSKLAGLPFRYSLRVNKNGDSPEATVYIGKDFI